MSNMKREISRRDFIKGAAAGAMGVAAMGVLGACAGTAAPVEASPTQVPSTAVPVEATPVPEAAAEPQAVAADKKYAWETPPEKIPESQIDSEIETEIVIIGGGFSGLCCAVSAAESGARVSVLERMNSVIGRGGSIFAIDTKLTREKGYSIDVSKVYKRMMGYHSHRVDAGKWMLHATKSGEAMNWLIDHMTTASAVGGSDLTPVMEHWYEDPEDVNGEFPGTHEFLGGPNGSGPSANPQQDVCDNMARYCDNLGVDMRYGMDAIYLEKDDSGRVVSCIAKSYDEDKYYRFKGTKGVVIATGDFGADKEMLEKYCPWALDAGNGGIWTGAGHKMALWAGAGWSKNGSAPMIFCFQWRSITKQVRAFQGLMVNSDGKRYTNEDNVISHGALALMHQKGHYAYAIWDVNYANEPQWQNHAFVDGEPVFKDAQEVIDYWEENVNGPGFVEMNGSGKIEVKMIKTDTIEELVEKLGLPKEEALATIARYNSYCETGVDEEFLKRKELLLPVKTGPFYGMKCTPWFLSMTGGIRCNDNLQVEDPEGNIIPGLYVLGSAVGDMYANCYSTHFPGHNLGSCCLTFGYLTGAKLAKGEI